MFSVGLSMEISYKPGLLTCPERTLSPYLASQVSSIQSQIIVSVSAAASYSAAHSIPYSC